MNEVRESYARPAKGATFPFDESTFDDPPAVKPRVRKKRPPRVTAHGTLLVDPPPRKKPRKADEILRILDGITDSEPKRVKKLLASLPVPARNRLRIVSA